MNPDDHVCLCFHVSQRKIVNFLRRENPPVASLISECLGAGTGCRWCVPFLKKLHAMHRAGVEPNLDESPQEYAARRAAYRAAGGRRDDESDSAPISTTVHGSQIDVGPGITEPGAD